MLYYSVLILIFAGVYEPDKYEIEGTFSLIIKNLSDEDAGSYRCELLLRNTGYTAWLTIVSK